MALEVVYTPRFEKNLKQLIDYLQHRWNDKVVDDFTARMYEVITMLSEHPLMFRETLKHGVREVVVTEHNLLLYRVNKDVIQLIALFGTRQNPRKKLKGL